MVMPREVLLALFSPENQGMELTAVLHAQRSFGTPRAADNPVVLELQRMAEQQKVHTKEARRLRMKHGQPNDDDESSADGSGEGTFDAAECLAKYGLPSIDHGHLLGFQPFGTWSAVQQKRNGRANLKMPSSSSIRRHRRAYLTG